MFRAGVFCLGASTLTAVLIKQQYELGFPGELAMIIFWSIPFAFGLTLIAPIVAVLFSSLPRLLTYPLAILVGAVIGYLWERIIYLFFINPMFGNFSVPVFFVWVAGGIAGMVAIAGLGSRAGQVNLLFEILLAALFIVWLGIGGRNLAEGVYQPRQVNVVWIRWVPQPGVFILDRHVEDELTIEEINEIKAQGLSGRFYWEGTSNLEKGPVSRLVIIMQQPVDMAVDLDLPAELPVMYIQKSTGEFIMTPPEAPLLRRPLRIGPDPDFPGSTFGFFKVPQGTHIFGGINWERNVAP